MPHVREGRARASASALGPDQISHLPKATPFRQGKGSLAAAIGNMGTGPGIQQVAQDLCVIGATIAQHDRFNQRGPAQIVDMIEMRTGLDQDA